MDILQQIDQALKSAMLALDKSTAETLRTVKSAILNEAISQGVRDEGLSDEQAQKVLAREAKKRTEAAELYQKAGATDRADQELAEKKIIDQFLPEQMNEADLQPIVAEEVSKLPNPTAADMGKIIGAVRARTAGTADGALIARLVKQLLESK